MRPAVKTILPVFALLLVHGKTYSWGFYGHRLINKMAVFTLPPEMLSFYKENLEYLSAHGVDPDKRRHGDPAEAPRHYIDLEFYSDFHHGTGVDSVPMNWKSAEALYGEDSINSWGALPWTIRLNYYNLVKAFREKNQKSILKYSADIGHYMADGHVPLHTTVNYNGQLTGQKGIHALWESRIPELLSKQYDLMAGKAVYIGDLGEFIREMIRTSHLEKDTVLEKEKQLNDRWEPDKKYTIGDQNNGIKKNYSAAYVRAYSAELDGMVERKMRSSILAVGSIWYTAWIEAGQPVLK